MKLFSSARIALFCSSGYRVSSDEKAPEGYRFARLAREVLFRAALVREKNRYPHFLSRLDAGHEVYGFLDRADEVVCYLWVSVGPTVAPFEVGLNVRLDASQIYIWDCRTASAHRRKGLYQSGLRRLMGWTRSQKTITYIVSRSNNESSIRAIKKAGFAENGVMEILELGPLRWIRLGKQSRLAAAGNAIGLQQLS
jgi:hypothetical protein